MRIATAIQYTRLDFKSIYIYGYVLSKLYFA